MNTTPLSNRLHIGIFGRRNAGKSTLINALTGQEAAIVSERPGTTTDPVYKAMEIHDLGPVVLIDTGGIDDNGPVGRKRVERAYKVLDKTDVALLVVDCGRGMGEYEESFITETKARNIPVIVVLNKVDAFDAQGMYDQLSTRKLSVLRVSAARSQGVDQVRKKIVQVAPDDFERKIILADILRSGDIVVLVAPLDIEAPKGRLKLPQVQTIRDILDSNCVAITAKETELPKVLSTLVKKPQLVIAESQVFDRVKALLPLDIPLTSFSILYARYKGDLETFIEGASRIEQLAAGDRILIAEACTHHPIGDDVARVVIPRLLNARFKNPDEQLVIDYVAGYDFPRSLGPYKLINHCGGCMLTRRQVMHRLTSARQAGVPVTNYGILIAAHNGILERATNPLRGAEKCMLNCPSRV